MSQLQAHFKWPMNALLTQVVLTWTEFALQNVVRRASAVLKLHFVDAIEQLKLVGRFVAIIALELGKETRRWFQIDCK